MDTLSALIADIPQPDRAAMAQAQQHLDGLLKPPAAWAAWRRWPCSWLECRG